MKKLTYLATLLIFSVSPVIAQNTPGQCWNITFQNNYALSLYCINAFPFVCGADGIPNTITGSGQAVISSWSCSTSMATAPKKHFSSMVSPTTPYIRYSFKQNGLAYCEFAFYYDSNSSQCKAIVSGPAEYGCGSSSSFAPNSNGDCGVTFSVSGPSS